MADVQLLSAREPSVSLSRVSRSGKHSTRCSRRTISAAASMARIAWSGRRALRAPRPSDSNYRMARGGDVGEGAGTADNIHPDADRRHRPRARRGATSGTLQDAYGAAALISRRPLFEVTLSPRRRRPYVRAGLLATPCSRTRAFGSAGLAWAARVSHHPDLSRIESLVSSPSWGFVHSHNWLFLSLLRRRPYDTPSALFAATRLSFVVFISLSARLLAVLSAALVLALSGSSRSCRALLSFFPPSSSCGRRSAGRPCRRDWMPMSTSWTAASCPTSRYGPVVVRLSSALRRSRSLASMIVDRADPLFVRRGMRRASAFIIPSPARRSPFSRADPEPPRSARRRASSRPRAPELIEYVLHLGDLMHGNDCFTPGSAVRTPSLYAAQGLRSPACHLAAGRHRPRDRGRRARRDYGRRRGGGRARRSSPARRFRWRGTMRPRSRLSAPAPRRPAPSSAADVEPGGDRAPSRRASCVCGGRPGRGRHGPRLLCPADRSFAVYALSRRHRAAFSIRAFPPPSATAVRSSALFFLVASFARASPHRPHDRRLRRGLARHAKPGQGWAAHCC